MSKLLELLLSLLLTEGLLGKKYLEMILTSFLDLAGRGGGGGALLIVTRFGILVALFTVGGTTLGVSLAEIFSLRDLEQLSV